MNTILAIDIGGTQLRAGIYPRNEITPIIIKRVHTYGTEAGVIDRLTELIDSVWPKEPVDIVCVAVPGPVNPHTGIVIETPNIPSWKNYPLAEILFDKYKIPTFIGNDANMAALGEWFYGAGQGHQNIVYMTISTGVGGGVICDNKLIEGYHGMATELGHMTVLPDGPMCSCGVRGHLEALASGPAIARYVEERIETGRKSILGTGLLTAQQIADAAQDGDELSIEAFERAGRYLGQACADFIHLFNPSIMIFGGGVSLSGELLFRSVKESIHHHIMNEKYLDGLEFATAKLGDDAGLLGVVAQAQIKLETEI
jgi:glucokinase